MTPDQFHAAKAEAEMTQRNRPLTDEELDAMLPGAEQVGGGALHYMQKSHLCRGVCMYSQRVSML
jgi:hypothetical protein